ncbi:MULTISPECIES: hypothetical protein [Bosea]|jgi:hypothetical protein|uniref:hypothetical protein n=1 Tax=Bosea TaxID=85413 RepID=UPI0021503BFB|nr:MULTISPECIES: hypothetical protein [Bosea]MCR4520461.1 hypothetical protein [Bosea sp. 47.2.35]MDR6827814.1 hypothetical protein [Bosea robiniae]MDR6894492.1 hypothetical protein [Bosea sp. BE109]MDR7137920.1 hypothetical protein [Bosea sp. BE168]MDR7174619.1 hypothetical protein [Bosea sp. BE271]
MKHKQQMSLIARRAQIRRAAASRKDQPALQPAGRPVLRLVTATGYDTERDQLHEHREQASAID